MKLPIKLSPAVPRCLRDDLRSISFATAAGSRRKLLIFVDKEAWRASEREIDLGGGVLKRQAITLLDTRLARLTTSIPPAWSGWSERMAAYRDLDNDDATLDGHQALHWWCSPARKGCGKAVLMWHDTAGWDFNGQSINGLGPSSYVDQRAVYVHSTYAADRESNVIKLMACAGGWNIPANWPLRAQRQRALPGGEKLWYAVMSGEKPGESSFTLPAILGQVARVLRRQPSARVVDRPHAKYQTVHPSYREIKALHSPVGGSPVKWPLLIKRSVEALAEAVGLIDAYCARGKIEGIFHIRNGGSRKVSLPLRTIDNLQRVIAPYLMISGQIAAPMRFGRIFSNLWAGLFRNEDGGHTADLDSKKQPPSIPLIRSQILRLTGMLGGFLARKGDGKPAAVKTCTFCKTPWRVLFASMASEGRFKGELYINICVRRTSGGGVAVAGS